MKLFLFDCDGTLIDSQHMIVRAMRDAFLSLEMAPPQRADMLHTVGLSPVEAMRHLAPGEERGLHETLALAYRAAFQALRRKSNFAEPMFPGARRALSALASRPHALLGIATGKSRRGVNAVLLREGLAGIFSTIQTADDAPSKPHPGMILNALSETGASPGNAVMIGDTTHDMLMAKAAGATGLGVAWGYHREDELRRAGADAVVQDFPALIAWLDAPGKGCAA